MKTILNFAIVFENNYSKKFVGTRNVHILKNEDGLWFSDGTERQLLLLMHSTC